MLTYVKWGQRPERLETKHCGVSLYFALKFLQRGHTLLTCVDKIPDSISHGVFTLLLRTLSYGASWGNQPEGLNLGDDPPRMSLFITYQKNELMFMAALRYMAIKWLNGCLWQWASPTWEGSLKENIEISQACWFVPDQPVPLRFNVPVRKDIPSST